MADTDSPQSGSWIIGIAGFLVTAVGLLVLLGIVYIALDALPSGTDKAQNVVAISTSAFGVIGAIVGAYFGVRAAGNAVDKVIQHSGGAGAGDGGGGGGGGTTVVTPSASS